MRPQDNYPKVLVAIPIYEGKEYMFKENFKCIKELDYPNYDYIYIDNSEYTSYYYKLKKRDCNVVHVDREGNSRQALTNAQNYARQKAIEEGYDYLMFIESDLTPPKDAITRLMNHELPVVGGTYFIGTGDIKTLCVFFTRQNKQGIWGTVPIMPKDVKEFLNTGLRRVHGIGLGCTLIRRDLFTRFNFWTDERFDNKHSDVYFYMDLWNAQIPVHVDTNFLVPHYPSDWSKVKDK